MVAENKHILVVDDDPAIRRLTARMIHSMGYSASVAENGRVALNECSSTGRVDLILSDVRMEQMNGVELVAALRGMNDETKIILISGLNDVDCLDSNTFFMQKPYTRESLQNAITEAFSL